MAEFAAHAAAPAGHANFVHLRVKTPFSLLEGALPSKELAALCREYRIPAAAITDTNNLFGIYETADTLAKAGIQPIVGVTLSVDLQASAAASPARPCRCSSM
jgi:DNA polymerase-3 subunit alpha